MTIKYYDIFRTNAAAVQSVGMPAVFVSNGLDLDKRKDAEIWDYILDEISILYDPDEVEYLTDDLSSGGLFFFKSREEQDKFYAIFDSTLTIGSPILVASYSAAGEFEFENTEVS